MEQYTLTVTPEQAGKRLDMLLMEFGSERSFGISRTFLQELIKEGRVSVNGAPALKPHLKIQAGEIIAVRLRAKPAPELSPEAIPLDVLHEDSDVAVINKQTGLVVHPAPGNYQHTLVNALLQRFSDLSTINPGRPGIVHRLDKETSGVMVIAKNNEAHLKLARQFEDHSIRRRYIAVVTGRVEFDEDVIEIPVGRHPDKRTRMSASFSPLARYAKTRYKTLKRSAGYSLLELEPFTGRTHQLRVHLAYVGHPVAGDAIYGKKGTGRMCLHARSLGFIHPATKKFVEFSTDIPLEFLDYFHAGK